MRVGSRSIYYIYTRFSADLRWNVGVHSNAIVRFNQRANVAASLPAMDVLNSAAWRLGYESLREEQAAVVHAFVEGNDVFASLETISSLTS